MDTIVSLVSSRQLCSWLWYLCTKYMNHMCFVHKKLILSIISSIVSMYFVLNLVSTQLGQSRLE